MLYGWQYGTDPHRQFQTSQRRNTMNAKLISSLFLVVFAAFPVLSQAETHPTTQITANSSDNTSHTGQPAVPPTGIQQINVSHDCSDGGKRVITGTYDNGPSGAINLLVTLTGCSFDGGEVHDGKVTIVGTLTTSGTDSAKKITQNLTYTYNTTISGTANYTRACTVVRFGTYDDSTQLFTGTETENNCSLQGSWKEAGGAFSGILSDTTKTHKSKH
jgi:hypothetical protein